MSVGTLVVALLASMAGSAEALDRLQVRRAVVLVDRGLVVFDVRCRATRERCAGTLRAATIDGDAIAARRRLRLPSTRARRFSLRLRSDGLRRLALAGSEGVGEMTVTDRLGRSLTGGFVLRAQVSCRTGSTLAASVSVRVFRLFAFGVYACFRPAGRPMLLAEEDYSLVQSAVEAVRISGPVVAFSTLSAWKCSGWAVNVFDVGAGRIVRQRAGRTTRESVANGCVSTTAVVALVVHPSGAVAWTEAAGDAGEVALRAVDDSGDRTLDMGPDLDPASLRLVGTDGVSWTRGGELQTAPLD
jgi:hypothetical protein